MKMLKAIGNRVITAILVLLSVLLAAVLALTLIVLVKYVRNQDLAPSVFGYTPLVVRTDSMQGENADSFCAGDLVIVKAVDAETLAKDNVIAFYNNGAVVIHRIVSMDADEAGKPVFVTKGDARDTEDQTRVASSAVIGCYTKKVAGFGTVFDLLQNPLLLLIPLIVPVLIYLMIDTRRVSKRIRAKQLENAALCAQLEQLRGMQQT